MARVYVEMIPQHMRTAVHAGIVVALLAVGVRMYQADPEWVVAQATVWTNYACALGGILLLVVVHLVVDNWAALFGTVEEGLEQHGGQLVANVLKAHGKDSVAQSRSRLLRLRHH